MTFLLVGSLTVAGCNFGQQAGPGGPAAPQEVGVVTIHPQSVTLSTDLPGRTASYRVAVVRPQVNGVLLKRMFDEGMDVKEGEQLYQIDPAPYQAALDSTLAQLQHAEAVEETDKAQADRYQALKNTNAISKQDYDTTMATEKQALADIASAKAAVESAQINLTYTRVLAPISGRTGRSITEGALVTSDQALPLVTIQQLDPIYVDIPESTAVLTRLRREVGLGQIKSIGQDEAPITLTLEDGSMYDEPGTLQFSEVTVDQSTGSVIQRAVFPNPKAFLLPGMFVTAHVEEGISENGILVPQQGVMRDPKGQASVFLVTADNKVALRNIHTDRAIGDKWFVTDGLAAGDRVVVLGLQKVMPGASVHATEATPDVIEAAAAKENQ
ncbi:MAG TPA: efflux RND transporter periplasmic adaptor subunit [Candidatus Methylacidiphilales bacterium]|nr:efflux RND transporter periplasmic adaptor subunit [Candidatus Methylacidiphilales bacterium]